MLALKVDSLTKAFSSTTVLRGATFDAFWGELILLTGENGAGKSTLLNCLSGQTRPDAGSWKFTGPNQEILQSKHLGVLDSTSMFYGNLSATENLEFYSGLYGLNNSRTRVAALLEEMGLERYANKQVKEYSQGMVKRLSIARAILHQPLVLLLDEPFNALDERGCSLLSGIIERFQKQKALQVVVSHHHSLLNHLSPRYLCLSEGKIYEQPREVEALAP